MLVLAGLPDKAYEMWFYTNFFYVLLEIHPCFSPPDKELDF